MEVQVRLFIQGGRWTYLITFSHSCGVPRRIQTLQCQQVQLGIRVVSDFMHNLAKKQNKKQTLRHTYRRHEKNTIIYN